MRRTVNSVESLIVGQNGFVNGGMQPIARIDLGTQDGLTTDFRIINATTPYVKQNVLCFLLEAPYFFNYLNNGEQMVAALKALMEGSQKIDGLDGTIAAEYAEVQAGATEVQHAFQKSTRARSAPQHTWTERYGLTISRFFQTWITMGMGDPITGVPGVVTLKSNAHLTQYGKGHEAYTLMPENIAMTCLYIEPDPTLSYPLKSFLICNMMPRQAGDWQASADRTGTPDTMEISIEFTGMQEINTGVNNLALMTLQSINKTGLFSADRRAFIGDNHRPYSEEGGSVQPNVFGASSVLPRPDGSNGLVGYRAQAESIATSESAASMSGGQGLHVRTADEHGPGTP